MIRRAWDRVWWKAESPYNLAGVRIVIAAHALWVLLSRDLPAMSALPAPFWVGVPESARWRYLIFPDQMAAESVVNGAVVLALLAVAAGWHARVSAALAAFGLYHLAPLETIHWTTSPYERGFEVAVLALVVLAASRCDEVWALTRPRHDAAPGPAPDFRWPLVLIRIYVAQIFFFAGYAKLYRVGLDWVSAENMSRWLLLFAQQDQVFKPSAWASWIADRSWLAWLTAASAVGLDLAFMATPFSQLARRVLVPAAALFNFGILLVMGIAFLNAPQLLVFVNWDWPHMRLRLARLGRVLPAPASGG